MSINAERILAVRTEKTIYKDRDTVLKVFGSSYTQSHVLHEAMNQAQMKEVGLPVPEVLEVVRLEDKWAIRSAYIPGKTMYRLSTEQPEQFEQYFDLFLDIQMEILSKSIRLLSNLKDELHRIVISSALEATVRYELHARLQAMPTEKAICHGDFNPSNIIIDPNGKYWVLDWAHATQGNPEADIAMTYLWLLQNGQAKLAEVYLERYGEKSGVPRKQVERWVPIVAAAQSVKATAEKRAFLLDLVKFTE